MGQGAGGTATDDGEQNEEAFLKYLWRKKMKKLEKFAGNLLKECPKVKF